MLFASWLSDMAIVLNSMGCVCALGVGHGEIVQRAMAGDTSGMMVGNVVVDGHVVPFGCAPVETKSQVRCHDLIKCAVKQIAQDIEDIKQKYKSERLGVVVGASNTAVHEAQEYLGQFLASGQMPKDFAMWQLELGMPAEYLRELVGFSGPAFTVSTACSSALKAFRSARDLLINDVCDAVLVGGVDARCDFALNGFYALGALSMGHTNPMSVNRDGINLGEGAALFIMTRADDGIKMMGVGESSDAYHLTSPDPTGNGAAAAMRAALLDAGLNPQDIDFINMHGTGTVANDEMEAQAISDVFGDGVLCASSKPLTGHVLGGAGAISAALGWLMLKHQFVIPHVWDGCVDERCAKISIATGTENLNVRRVLCNAFAFGGSNASLILGV